MDRWLEEQVRGHYELDSHRDTVMGEEAEVDSSLPWWAEVAEDGSVVVPLTFG